MTGGLNNNNPLVTLIVPAHNSERFLGRCLNSLVSQSYRNLEIIVVVNACNDDTKGVASLFADSDPRIRVVCTDVPGVSHARNLALASADGAYVGFADADDWVESGMVEAMVSAAIARGADVVCSGKILETPRGAFENSVADYVSEISADEFYYGVLMAPYCGAVWNKLFSRRALEGRRFDESMAIIEDSAFCCALANDELRFIAIPGCFYHYVSNDDSATHDLSCLVTKEGKWAYLEGALAIQSRANTESQWHISEDVNCTFAASGVREVAGIAEYEGLHRELRDYLRLHLRSYIGVEKNRATKVKTLCALYAPALWHVARKCAGLIR